MKTFVGALVCALLIFSATTAAQAAKWQDNLLGQVSSQPAPATRQAPTRSRASTRARRARAKTTRRATPRTRARRSIARTKQRRHRRSGSRRSSYRGRTLHGLASYYWQPQRVASGGWFNPNALTAAHKSLPFGTRVRVTNMRNGRSVVVRINDRGPYIRGRIIDLSRRAATIVGMRGAGVVPVRVQVL